MIDASAALHFASQETGFSLLADFQLAAPPLMWSEAFSVLHESRWRRDVSSQLSAETRERLIACPARVYVGTRALVQAWEIADRLGWAKTYDAEYIALARQLSCPLLTIDARLQRGASHLVRIVSPADL